MMKAKGANSIFGSLIFIGLIFGVLIARGGASLTAAQELTPLQRKIETERARLSSSDVETRRDAVMRLAALNRPEAARAAIAALNDSSPVVRAAAAHALQFLDHAEAAALLVPLLRNDKDEFVRRETAYALGEAHNQNAISELIAALAQDKSPAVRAAAAVALGEVGARSSVPALALSIVRRQTDAQLDAAAFAQTAALAPKRKAERDDFVRREAARALGELKDARAVPALMAVLNDKRANEDLRREAARALGEIGDARAVNALQNALDTRDPYLLEAARAALKKISSKSIDNRSED
jgi:HEAT repeat protein